METIDAIEQFKIKRRNIILLDDEYLIDAHLDTFKEYCMNLTMISIISLGVA